MKQRSGLPRGFGKRRDLAETAASLTNRRPALTHTCSVARSYVDMNGLRPTSLDTKSGDLPGGLNCRTHYCGFLAQITGSICVSRARKRGVSTRHETLGAGSD